MSWFGEKDMKPILGSGNEDQREAGRTLRKAGVDSHAMVGVHCSCGGEDGAHVPNAPCEGVN